MMKVNTEESGSFHQKNRCHKCSAFEHFVMASSQSLDQTYIKSFQLNRYTKTIIKVNTDAT